MLLRITIRTCCALLISLIIGYTTFAQAKRKINKQVSIVNFNNKGQQVTRFTNVGQALDAHDGEIALFNGTYYLYGTSYDCGFEWGNKTAPFCGFKAYSSRDMVHWTDRGFLFNARTPIWQTRCDGKTYGCFRPHVIYNNKTRLYVLWINVYDNVVGYRVFTSKAPVGPFTEVAEPHLAVNGNMPAAGLNNGDHDTFVDDDGTAYLAYTDWRTNGQIVIEKLSDDYLTGTGQFVQAVTNGKTEAPGLFKRKGVYYVVYSDPNCGYCSGTGAAYRTARSPLGPWSAGIRISDNSCGGQPSFVSTIKLGSGNVYLFGSDLWNNAAKNEARANFFWTALQFNADGSIKPIACQTPTVLPIADKPVGLFSNDGYTTACDISGSMQRSQCFMASLKTLAEVRFTTFKSGYPNAGLQCAVYAADATGKPTGRALTTVTLTADEIGWSPNYQSFKTDLKVTAGKRYVLVFSSASTTGCYGFASKQSGSGAGAGVSTDNGASFTIDKGMVLKCQQIFL